jgi:hypothetical protein
MHMPAHGRAGSASLFSGRKSIMTTTGEISYSIFLEQPVRRRTCSLSRSHRRRKRAQAMPSDFSAKAHLEESDPQPSSDNWHQKYPRSHGRLSHRRRRLPQSTGLHKPKAPDTLLTCDSVGGKAWRAPGLRQESGILGQVGLLYVFRMCKFKKIKGIKRVRLAPPAPINIRR